MTQPGEQQRLALPAPPVAGSALGRAQAYLPGLLVSGLAALAAGFFADHYSAPLTLIALLFGLSLNFLNSDPRLGPGLALAAGTLLRIGIVLVGARVTTAQVAQMGLATFVSIVGIAGLTLLSGVLAARALGLGSALGALAGGAVAICGASAALAIAAVLGERRIGKTSLALVIVVVSAMSSLSMLAFPVIAHVLGLKDVQAGFLFGAAIHDVAQSLGAGFSYSPHAGETAAIVKLTRVALLAPVLMIVGWHVRKDAAPAGREPPIPWFVAGFFALAILNSVHILPAVAVRGAMTGTTGLLAWAVAATGIRAPMAGLMTTGLLRPVAVILTSSLVALGLALAYAVFGLRTLG
jgi:uncharacterized integral membrane protein (TIGR00698 family)